MPPPIDSFQDLELGLREALPRLHDPDLVPADVLFTLASTGPDDGPGPVQAEIIKQIDALAPRPDTPRLAETRRAHSILHARYVQKLTLEETADQLGLSIRHLTRLQREAVHTLARIIWERIREPDAGAPSADAVSRSGRRGQPEAGWREQVRREVSILDHGGADAECNLAVAIPRALRIAQALGEDRQIAVSANSAPPEPKVLMHASAIQHILLSLTEALISAMEPGGEVVWRTERCPLGMEITITARPVAGHAVAVPDLVQELLVSHGGSVGQSRDGKSVSAVLQLPSEAQPDARALVLAIDDNAGLVSLFQSYCKGTRYEIVHVAKGSRALEAVRSCRPQAILLDVLLPDVDGWALLVELRRDPLASSIPIILCSVTTDEHLALRLGANLYLRKPVWRQDLIQALDQVLSPAEAAPQRDAGNTPPAY